MKKHIFYRKLVFLMVAFGLVPIVRAQETVSKTIEKTIPITQDGSFYIVSKYGDINIQGTERDQLEITMKVTVDDKEESAAMDLLERVQPEIKIVGDMVYLTSDILEKGGNVFSRYFNKANPLKTDRNNVQIDYTIKVPKHISLDVDNKYGDLILDAFVGGLNVQVQHGDMWINNDIEQATIDIKFGKLKARAINKGSITLKNAEMDLKSSSNMTLNSSGSVIAMEEVANVDLVSSKDRISIERVVSVKGEIKFSTLTIASLAERMEATMKITDVSIAKITESNPVIAIEQESSDIRIDITGTRFKFKAYYTEGIIKLPKTFDNIDSNMIDKGKKLREINATYGKNSLGSISVSGYRGTLTLSDDSLSNK